MKNKDYAKKLIKNMLALHLPPFHVSIRARAFFQLRMANKKSLAVEKESGCNFKSDRM